VKLHLKPIRTRTDYRAALKIVENFFDASTEPDPNSEQGVYFDALVTLIEAYERKHYPGRAEWGIVRAAGRRHCRHLQQIERETAEGWKLCSARE
jgi:antitoxin component HigA of HigAB toxin-antitoxin module